MPFDFGDEPTNTGDTVGVQCLANKGDLPMEIRWILNSSPIISGENGITIMKMNQRTSSLNINSVEGMHRGIFKCLVSNQAGTVEHLAELNVNGLFHQQFYHLLYMIDDIVLVHFIIFLPLIKHDFSTLLPSNHILFNELIEKLLHFTISHLESSFDCSIVTQCPMARIYTLIIITFINSKIDIVVNKLQN